MLNSCYVKGILVYVLSVAQRYLKTFQVCEIAIAVLFILLKRKKIHVLARKGVSAFSFNLEKGKQKKREEGRKEKNKKKTVNLKQACLLKKLTVQGTFRRLISRH